MPAKKVYLSLSTLLITIFGVIGEHIRMFSTDKRMLKETISNNQLVRLKSHNNDS